MSCRILTSKWKWNIILIGRSTTLPLSLRTIGKRTDRCVYWLGCSSISIRCKITCLVRPWNRVLMSSKSCATFTFLSPGNLTTYCWLSMHQLYNLSLSRSQIHSNFALALYSNLFRVHPDLMSKDWLCYQLDYLLVSELIESIYIHISWENVLKLE